MEAPKKKSSKSPYARVTDTGIDPELAAKRLNVDWDSAAEIGDADDTDETEVPPVVVCFLVTVFNIGSRMHVISKENWLILKDFKQTYTSCFLLIQLIICLNVILILSDYLRLIIKFYLKKHGEKPLKTIYFFKF